MQSAILLTLAALALARGLAAALPGHWAWGLDVLRFAPPWTWGLWAASALCLLPAVGHSLDGPVADFGRRLERGWMWPAALAVAAALVLLLFPDRIHYVGDSLLRADAVAEGVPARALTPQALPLDVWFHSTLPGWLATLGISSIDTARWLGALEAGVLAVLAVALSRALGLSGAALVGASALVFWGGWLALFAGFGKAFSELVLAALGLAGLGLSVFRGRRHLTFGLVLAAAILLHRSALGFLPAALWAWYAGRNAAERSGRTWFTLVPPALALALVAPRLWESMRAFDTTHFAAPGESAGAALTRLLAPLRLMDLANLSLFLVPLWPLLVTTANRRERPSPLLEPAQRRYLLVLALPFAITLFFLRPAQGIVRDFDDYSTGAMAVAVLVAARVGSRLRAVQRAGWLAAAVTLGAAAPIVGWLALESEIDRGLARVEALVAGPPLRSEDERAKTLDYLGGRWFRAERYDRAEAELERAAALAPSPRLVLGWATAAEKARDFPAAERAYRLLYERASMMEGGERVRAVALGGLATAAARRGDFVEARRWAEQAVRESPGDPGPAELFRRILAAQADTSQTAR